MNKIFPRILHERLVDILPTIISTNQVGFVKGRSIIKNVFLAQEIIIDIRFRAKPANLVIKLDMAKAYDRVSWLFLTKVLQKMNFGERVIDIIFRLLCNNWYSILINGKPIGFFRSTRDAKQGDPLSPTLFYHCSINIIYNIKLFTWKSILCGFWNAKMESVDQSSSICG